MAAPDNLVETWEHDYTIGSKYHHLTSRIPGYQQSFPYPVVSVSCRALSQQKNARNKVVVSVCAMSNPVINVPQLLSRDKRARAMGTLSYASELSRFHLIIMASISWMHDVRLGEENEKDVDLSDEKNDDSGSTPGTYISRQPSIPKLYVNFINYSFIPPIH